MGEQSRVMGTLQTGSPRRGKMQVFVRNLAGRTSVYDVSADDSVADLKMEVPREGVPAMYQRLVSSGAEFRNGTLSECGIESDATLDLLLTLEGGVIEPTLAALAKSYNVDKQICRKCYARLPPRAKNCRKKKCGHSNQLRPKKKLK